MVSLKKSHKICLFCLPLEWPNPLNRVGSSDPSLLKTISKLRKTSGFTRRIFFYIFLNDFYSLETFILYRWVKTFETAWEMLISTRGRKRLFQKTRISIFRRFICCYYNHQSWEWFDKFTSNIHHSFFHSFIIFHKTVIYPN